jgi:uncharacterized protein YgbK (DUF1537 family)
MLAYYGDDFTGSTDALEFLSRAGAKTALFIAAPTAAQLARFEGLQAVGVAGMTRAMTPEAMEAELRPAFTALKALGAPHVHYKVCSTFDSSPTIGSIGRAIEVGSEIFGSPFVPLLVGAPPLGRYSVFGNLFARMGIGSDGVIHRLDRHPSMSRHPVTPADESDLRLHLARQTQKRIALFDILQVARPEAEARSALDHLLADHPDIVLFDVLYNHQLERIGAMLDAHASPAKPLFSVGSSGIEMALGAHWASTRQLTPAREWPEPGAVDQLLVLSGSCSPVTERQIHWSLAHGYVGVALDTAALAAGDATRPLYDAMSEVAGHLKAGRSVVVHTNQGGGGGGGGGDADPRVKATADAFARRNIDRTQVRSLTAQLFGEALGRVARAALEQVSLRRLVIAGGDTSSYAARALGIEAVEMIAPLSPGAPLCRAHALGSPADGLEINFKGGQVGAENYFEVVKEGRFHHAEPPRHEGMKRSAAKDALSPTTRSQKDLP